MERANKEVMRFLRESIWKVNEIDTWEQWLPMVQSKINVTKHESTGVEPYKLIYGASMEPDLDLIAPNTTNIYERRLSDWVFKHIQIFRLLQEEAQISQRNLDNSHLLTRERGERTEFEINSYVLVRYRGGLGGNKPTNKLLPIFRGPLKVIRYKDNEYALQNLVTGKIELHHVTNLRPFYFDPTKTNPEEIAVKDYSSSFLVEKILRHRENLKGPPKDLSFEVKWLNYDDSENTWEPLANVRNNIIFHQYIKDHNFPLALIPVQFRK